MSLVALLAAEPPDQAESSGILRFHQNGRIIGRKERLIRKRQRAAVAIHTLMLASMLGDLLIEGEIQLQNVDARIAQQAEIAILRLSVNQLLD